LCQQWTHPLTHRESEIVLLMGAGLSNGEIAQRLGTSVGTVKIHVHSIFRKTGAESRYKLVVQLATRSSVA